MSKKMKRFIYSLVVAALILGWQSWSRGESIDVTRLLPSPTPQRTAGPTSSPVIAMQERKTVKPTVSASPHVLGDETLSTPEPGSIVNEGGVARVHATVSRVVDGDTIELSDGRKVRYIGIDSPETVQPNTAVQCYGEEASRKNKALVEGKEVELEKDVSNTDRYGRLLRYVFVDGVFVNDYLVKEGYAYSSAYPPDVKYQEIFKESQKEARESEKGLWGAGCPATK